VKRKERVIIFHWRIISALYSTYNKCQMDDMVLEYLLFRGFTRSFRAVVADSQGDRLRAFEVFLMKA